MKLAPIENIRKSLKIKLVRFTRLTLFEYSSIYGGEGKPVIWRADDFIISVFTFLRLPDKGIVKL